MPAMMQTARASGLAGNERDDLPREIRAILRPAQVRRPAPYWQSLLFLGCLIPLTLLGIARFIDAFITPLDLSYSAAIPGGACDRGAGIWSAPTDGSVALNCERGDMLLSQSSGFVTSGEIFFAGTRRENIPVSYRTAVDVTLDPSQPQTGAGIEVHHHFPQGGQRFLLLPNGQWSVQHIGAPGSSDQRLVLGFISMRTMTHRLAVEVRDRELSFFIDGVRVAYTIDAYFGATPAIALAVDDGQATAPIAARFANFYYVPQFYYLPLSASTLLPEDVQTRVDAQNHRLHDLITFVKVPALGQGCGRLSGIWAMPGVFGDTTTQALCGLNGAIVTHNTPPGQGPTMGEIRFYNRDGRFPHNYGVAVTVTTGSLNGGCVGIVIYADDYGNQYATLLCRASDGEMNWAIQQMQPGQVTTLASGPMPPDTITNTSYDLAAYTYGTYIGLRANGVDLGAANVVLTATSYVALTLTAPPGVSNLAKFINFLFTPIPDSA